MNKKILKIAFIEDSNELIEKIKILVMDSLSEEYEVVFVENNSDYDIQLGKEKIVKTNDFARAFESLNKLQYVEKNKKTKSEHKIPESFLKKKKNDKNKLNVKFKRRLK